MASDFSEKAVCEVCGNEYGELDANNHKNTKLLDAVEATCTEEGYTGDLYCTDCEKQLEEGTTIPAKGHTGGEATCIAKAVCEVCGEEFGEINPANHKNTEVRNAVEATTEEVVETEAEEVKAEDTTETAEEETSEEVK